MEEFIAEFLVCLFLLLFIYVSLFIFFKYIYLLFYLGGGGGMRIEVQCINGVLIFTFTCKRVCKYLEAKVAGLTYIIS